MQNRNIEPLSFAIILTVVLGISGLAVGYSSIWVLLPSTETKPLLMSRYFYLAGTLQVIFSVVVLVCSRKLLLLLGHDSTLVMPRDSPEASNTSFQGHGDIYGDSQVLVVEDHPVNQKLVSRTLTLLGAKSIIVANGALAVEAVQKHKDIKLVLMDLQMPVMDGLEATRLIRESHPDLPIVALTADAMGVTSKRCFEIGMNDFLTKPLRRDLLSKKLEEYLK